MIELCDTADSEAVDPNAGRVCVEYDPILKKNCAMLSLNSRKLLALIRARYAQSGITLARLAGELHRNGKYLGRLFLRETGMTFCQYLRACRMEEAARLLLDSDERIAVIAGMVGYTQLNRFYAHFRRYHGESPVAMRRRCAREGKTIEENLV